MIPTLQPEDEVLVDPRAYVQDAPQVNDLVVARRPDRQEVTMVKRVTAVLADGYVLVEGDNPAASTDSHVFGPLPPQNLIGKVTSRFG